MKILYITCGLPHYYNLVLSKLNKQQDIELVVVTPKTPHVGEGVYTTNKDINFRVIELDSKKSLGLFTTFKGLSKVIEQENPDIIIIIIEYLYIFAFDFSARLARQKIGAKLILKSIPFRMNTYQETLNNIKKGVNTDFIRFPFLVNKSLKLLGIHKILRYIQLHINKYAYCLPDAHVNYINARELWKSYGIAPEKVFITHNSPDTELLLSINESLNNLQPILPVNPYRLIHVGRLVKWKNVDMLIHALARVKEKYPKVELLIIGTGPEEVNLKKLAEELSLENTISFIGGVYDSHLLGQYFKSSSVYVLAGMGGLSINEAMCFELPVLCSVCDGTEKALVYDKLNGRYFKDGIETDLIEKILWFFENKNEIKNMGKESLNIIKNQINIQTVIDGYLRSFNFVSSLRQ